MTEKFKVEFDFDDETADKLYENIMSMLGNELKEKLKHPFKSQD